MLSVEVTAAAVACRKIDYFHVCFVNMSECHLFFLEDFGTVCCVRWISLVGQMEPWLVSALPPKPEESFYSQFSQMCLIKYLCSVTKAGTIQLNVNSTFFVEGCH